MNPLLAGTKEGLPNGFQSLFRIGDGYPPFIGQDMKITSEVEDVGPCPAAAGLVGKVAVCCSIVNPHGKFCIVSAQQPVQFFCGPDIKLAFLAFTVGILGRVETSALIGQHTPYV